VRAKESVHEWNSNTIKMNNGNFSREEIISIIYDIIMR